MQPPTTGAGGIPTLGLFGGLLDRFTEMLGDGPSTATFHYASMQEGIRLGDGARPADLVALLRRVDEILGQHSALATAGPVDGVVRLEVHGSPLLASHGNAAQGVVLGLIEGVLKGVYHRPYEGLVESVTADGSDAVLVFRGRAAA